MSEQVLISTTPLDGLRWPSTCVRCGCPVPPEAPGASITVPACRRHARLEAVARWILSPASGMLALRAPVYLGFGWLLRFVATALHENADGRAAWDELNTPVQALFVLGLGGAIALIWAERTASLRVMYPDAARRRTLLRFRRSGEAHEFRALNPEVVVADAKPTPWWQLDSPGRVLACVAAVAFAVEVVHPIKAH